MSSIFAQHPTALHLAQSQSDYGFTNPSGTADFDQATGGRTKSWFTGGLPTPPAQKTMSGHAVSTHGLPARHVAYNSYSHTMPTASSSMQPTLSQSSYDSQKSTSRNTSNTNGYAVHGHKNSIASHLQIPGEVNKSKGSLAEFAAEITCLFWFESSETLIIAESTPKDGYVGRGFVADASPSPGFRKWVTTILSTTQVSKEVIILALMFIYRLKKFNPSVSGKRGSEFRLLTIALMLGNKFLDDNTYTNKTWAEVSGISVGEIHIMEVEFLSNMRYELYASRQEWLEWKDKLGRLGSYYEKASILPHTDVLPMTPTSQNFGHAKLPSPPSTHGNSVYGGYASLPNPVATAPQLPRSPLRPHRVPSIDMLSHRKRSLDSGSEPPAKKMHITNYENVSPVSNAPTPHSYFPAGPSMSYVSNSLINPTQSTDVPRLPMPRLPAQVIENQLAPLNVPGSRAMASVYAPTTSSWSQPITPVSTNPPNLYQIPIPSLGDASRSHSNMPSTHTSPNGINTVTPVLPGLSPSYFLGNRQSPYRPVRNVNTLLYPPPSAALQSSVRNIPAEQIRYQPLSKAAQEHRSGPVPYHQPENWQQSNTPLAQKYPYRF